MIFIRFGQFRRINAVVQALRVDLGMPLTQIVARLRQEGHKPRGKKWDRKLIRRILDREGVK